MHINGSIALLVRAKTEGREDLRIEIIEKKKENNNNKNDDLYDYLNVIICVAKKNIFFLGLSKTMYLSKIYRFLK